MTIELDEARQVLAELAALHEEGWCACQSSTLPARVQATLGDLIAALSSPPADDVRDRIVIRHVGGNTLGGTVEQVLSTHLAKGWSVESFEVRLRGTVTDAEVKAALDTYLDGAEPVDWQPGAMRAALEAAREARS